MPATSVLPPIRCSERIRARNPRLGDPSRAGLLSVVMRRRPASPRGKAFTCTWPRRRARAIGCSCTGSGGIRGSGGARSGACLDPLRPSCDCTPPPTTADSVTRVFRAPWRVTDRVESRLTRSPATTRPSSRSWVARTPRRGKRPLIVRQSPAAPASAVLVQVQVDTWEAYYRSGGKSLYQSAPACTPSRSRSIGHSTSRCSTTWSRSSNCPGSAFWSKTVSTFLPDRRRHGQCPRIAATSPFGVRDRPRRVLDAANARRLQPGAGAVDKPDVRLRQRRVADALRRLRANDRGVAGSLDRSGPQLAPRQRVLQDVRRARVQADGSRAPAGRAAQSDRAAHLVHGRGAEQRSMAGGCRSRPGM